MAEKKTGRTAPKKPEPKARTQTAKKKPAAKKAPESFGRATKAQIAELAGYSYQQLYNINKGLPEDEKIFSEGADGKCDLAAFVQRWTAYNVKTELEKMDDLNQIKARHETVKTRKTELEVYRMEGMLVDASDVKRMWADVAGTVTQNMLHIPNSLCHVLQGIEDAEVIKSILDAEIRKTLENIADAPIPWDEWKETEGEEEDGDDGNG